MLDPQKQAELEQAQAALVELYPPIWKQLYERCER